MALCDLVWDLCGRRTPAGPGQFRFISLVCWAVRPSDSCAMWHFQTDKEAGEKTARVPAPSEVTTHLMVVVFGLFLLPLKT